MFNQKTKISSQVEWVKNVLTNLILGTQKIN